MGLNKRLNKHLISDVKLKTLEHEKNKLVKRLLRYEELLAEKKKELERYSMLAQSLGGLLKSESQEKAFELMNCIKLTESKIKKINNNLSKIDDELVERMLTGEA